MNMFVWCNGYHQYIKIFPSFLKMLYVSNVQQVKYPMAVNYLFTF